MKPIAAIVMVLVLASRAAAQPVEPPAAPLPPPEELGERTAVELSVGTTVVAWTALIATTQYHEHNRVALSFLGLAVFAAPGLGQWYAGSAWTRGLALRTAGLLSLGLAASQPHEVCADFSSQNCGNNRLANGLVIAAIALYAAGTVDDIITAPAAVRRHNERMHHLAIAPIVRPG